MLYMRNCLPIVQMSQKVTQIYFRRSNFMIFTIQFESQQQLLSVKLTAFPSNSFIRYFSGFPVCGPNLLPTIIILTNLKICNISDFFLKLRLFWRTCFEKIFLKTFLSLSQCKILNVTIPKFDTQLLPHPVPRNHGLNKFESALLQDWPCTNYRFSLTKQVFFRISV